MNFTIVILICLAFFTLGIVLEREILHECPVIHPTADEQSRDAVLDAIKWVESRGDSKAVGDNGKAVGAYQITKIYVDDVNRIDWWNNYTYQDRYDEVKSREMTKTYICWYLRFTHRIIRDSGWWDKQFEYMARIHNGGPQGWKKDSTKPYWEKVKARMESQ